MNARVLIVDNYDSFTYNLAQGFGMLGAVAMRVGKKLEWDAKNLKATNCPEADQYIRKTYRKGWVLNG